MKKNILHSNIEILSNNLSKNCHQVKHGIYFVITSHEIPKKEEEANNILKNFNSGKIQNELSFVF